MKLGMIGLDCSHAVEFSRILNGSDEPFHIPGHPVTAACRGDISLDFDMSYERMEPFTNEVTKRWGVALCRDIREVMEQTDAVFLEQVDARKRPEQFREIAGFGKPVFVDKPFALSVAECTEMKEVAERYGVCVLSSSSLRFADGLTAALDHIGEHAIDGADFFGPMPMIPTQPGYFWYGIHMADMLFRTLGRGCRQVMAVHTKDHDVITGVWRDGRLGTIRGNRSGTYRFGGTIFYQGGEVFVDISKDGRGYYECLAEQIISTFDTCNSPVDLEETEEIIRFLEAANQSLSAGREVRLY